MLQSPDTENPPVPKLRIRGISRDAAALGVTRDHLRWVLQGKRESQILVQRYNALVAQRRTQGKSKHKPSDKQRP